MSHISSASVSSPSSILHGFVEYSSGTLIKLFIIGSAASNSLLVKAAQNFSSEKPKCFQLLMCLPNFSYLNWYFLCRIFAIGRFYYYNCLILFLNLIHMVHSVLRIETGKCCQDFVNTLPSFLPNPTWGRGCVIQVTSGTQSSGSKVQAFNKQKSDFECG